MTILLSDVVVSQETKSCVYIFEFYKISMFIFKTQRKTLSYYYSYELWVLVLNKLNFFFIFIIFDYTEYTFLIFNNEKDLNTNIWYPRTNIYLIIF